MDCREAQINTITSLTKTIKNTKVVSSQSCNEEIMSGKTVLRFAFTLLDSRDPYLSALENYLKGVHSDCPLIQDVQAESCYFPKARLFSDFAEANEGNDDIVF